MAVRTWAPRGQTPVLRVPLTRDHLSAISGITPDGRLFLQVRPASYDAEAVVGFLRVLLRKISGKILLIWDGSPIHRGHEIKDFLSLLSRPAALVHRAHSSQRALAAQAGGYSELFAAMWLFSLVSYREVSSCLRFTIREHRADCPDYR